MKKTDYDKADESSSSEQNIRFRFWRYSEMFLIFAVLPVIFFFDFFSIPKIPALLVLTFICLLVLLLDKNFDNSSLLKYKIPTPILKKVMLRFLLFCVILYPAVWLILPDEFLIFPRTNPLLWFIIMLIYPLASALPQELIYRSYFFHRFESLFPNINTTIIASAVAFSFLHIIYDNYIAIILTLAGGLLFGKTYSETKSLAFVAFEHSLYGCAIFTSGLGKYFFETLV